MPLKATPAMSGVTSAPAIGDGQDGSGTQYYHGQRGSARVIYERTAWRLPYPCASAPGYPRLCLLIHRPPHFLRCLGDGETGVVELLPFFHVGVRP